MIRIDQNHAAAAQAAASRSAASARSGARDFRALFDGQAAQAAAPAKTEAAAAEPPAGAPAPKAAAAQALPPEPPGVPAMYGPAAVENHMNQWLMGVLQRQNESRMEAYNNALEGWKNVNARNRELGLPETPPPPPPQLASIAPMPPGWWFHRDV